MIQKSILKTLRRLLSVSNLSKVTTLDEKEKRCHGQAYSRSVKLLTKAVEIIKQSNEEHYRIMKEL